MRLLHIGVFTEDRDPRRLPETWASDGDSFLEWGEFPEDDRDPVHLTIGPWHNRLTPSAVQALRSALSEHLRSGERLTDYAVETDADDWAESQRVFLLDGSVINHNDLRVGDDY